MRSNILKTAAVAVLACALAGGAAAQSLLPRPVVPKAAQAPAALSGAVPSTDAEIDAWMKANLKDVEDWTVIGYSEAGVALATYIEGGDVFDLLFRMEYFKPQAGKDGTATSSMLLRYEIHCRDKQRRALELGLFGGHDLKQPISRDADIGDWDALDPKLQADSFALEICEFVAAGPEPVEGPKTQAEADVLAWAAKSLQIGGDVYLYYEPDSINFIHGPVTRTPSKTYAFTTRTERFEPDDKMRRSYSLRVELDCAARRVRVSDGKDFPNHDLKGASAAIEMDDQWISPQHSAAGLQMDRMCAVAQAAAGA